MKKRLFLLMLMMITGIQPALHCADHEVVEAEAGHEEAEAFEPNIHLPLDDVEAIVLNDNNMPDQGYTLKWSYATLLTTYIVGAILLTRYKRHLYLSPFITNQCRRWLPSIVKRHVPYAKYNSMMLVPSLLFWGEVSYKLGAKIMRKFLDHDNQRTLALVEAINQHNRTVLGNYERQILTNQEGDRTLIMRRGNEVFAYPFDVWRRQRQEAINGMSWLERFLLGYENLRRIRAIHERLNTLDEHLIPNYDHIKGDDG